ncbi:MAG TPA: choice-of-anchor R domain-containing protein, partial [Burkholderiales bacterium]|nr:choice-of-anchor R domain-containing protein [Burkholderiales bacterium]
TQGDQFVAGASGGITDIDIALVNIDAADDLTLTLRSDSAGTPGAIIDTWIIDDALIPSTAGIVHVDADGLTNLVAGTTYWLIASAPSTSHYGWNLNDQDITGQHCVSVPSTDCDDLIETETLGAFRIEVDGAVVPEPATLALLGLGFAGLGFSRRKRNATR